MGTNSNSNTPIVALAAEYNFMKDNTLEKVVAQKVLQNIAQIPSLTLEQAAQMCNVSVPTFSRFCKSIGYTSYSAFKVKISEALENYNYKNSPFPPGTSYSEVNYITKLCDRLVTDIQNYSKIIDTSICCKVVEALHEAKRVHIHDALYSTIRLSLQSDLAVTGKKVFFAPNKEQQQQDVKDADKSSIFLLVYDFDVRSHQILKSIPDIKARGGTVAAIVPSKEFPGHELCDYIIEIGFGSTGMGELLLRDMAFQFLSVLYKAKFIQ